MDSDFDKGLDSLSIFINIFTSKDIVPQKAHVLGVSFLIKVFRTWT